MNQVAAIEEGDDGDARRQQARMIFGSVQLLDLLVDLFERRIAFRALPQKDDSLDHIVVVENFAILLMDGFAVPAEPDFRALRDGGDVLHLNRGAAFGSDYGLFDIVNGFYQSHRADVDLLQSRLDKAAAGVDVIIGELLFNLSDAQAIRDQLIGIEANLILLGDAAQARNIDHVGDGFQLLFNEPIFNRLQVHDVELGIGAVQSEEINLAHRAPVRTHLRLQSRGQGDLGETLQDFRPIPVVLRFIVEDQRDGG